MKKLSEFIIVFALLSVQGRLEILKDLVRDEVISVFEAAERMGMSVEEFQNDNNQRIEVESPEINR